MDLATITMDPAEADERFHAYELATKQRHDAELEAIRDGYAALADGYDLIDLHDVMRAAGTFENGLPRLAIARSDTTWVYYAQAWVSTPGQGSDRYPTFTTDPSCEGRSRYRAGTVRLPAGLFGLKWRERRDRGRAAVPVVPPDLIPLTDNGRLASLKHFWTLFEAEWEPIAPVDPVLLRHVGGSLYAVIAEWDLTELERAVMTRRFTT
ncbi:MAG: hypothetical protein AAGG50_03780 [Bacteroidota bacterium]